MALELVLPSGTIPVETSTSHEFPTVVNPKIVDRSNDFHVHANWQTQGFIFALFSPTFKWEAEAIFEQMGGGEFAGGPFITNVAYVQTAALQNYNVLINIPGAQFPEGVYRVILKLRLSTGGPTPICGFDDLGLVEFYN